MLIILNLKEAKAWVEEKLIDADSFLFPLNVAVNNGLLLRIDNEHFAVAETKGFGCT